MIHRFKGSFPSAATRGNGRETCHTAGRRRGGAEKSLGELSPPVCATIKTAQATADPVRRFRKVRCRLGMDCRAAELREPVRLFPL